MTTRIKTNMNVTNAMLCWNRGTSEVEVIKRNGSRDNNRKYSSSALGAFADIRDMSFEQRKTIVFIEAMHLIVRDKCDPMAVHRALLNLEEYVDGCADDMLQIG